MNRARVLILALGLAVGAALPAQAAAIDDTLVACARQADNAGLEDVLMREFFGS